MHDEIIYEGVLELERKGLIETYLNEAELKRGAPLESMHREVRTKMPDVIATSYAGHQVAIEIELTQKSSSRYLSAFNAYRKRVELGSIFWVIANPSISTSILDAARRAGFPVGSVPIGFINVGEWRLNAVEARVRGAGKTMPLGEYIRPDWIHTGPDVSGHQP